MKVWIAVARDEDGDAIVVVGKTAHRAAKELKRRVAAEIRACFEGSAATKEDIADEFKSWEFGEPEETNVV